MNESDIEFVKQCIKRDCIHDFYNWGKWKKLRMEVLVDDHFECQRCKELNKIYTKATTVHHVNYVKKHPELALEKYYVWQGKRKRNLISLCHECHEAVHGYRKKKTEALTAERWD